MTATTRQPLGHAGARWTLLLRPRWLVWHAFVVLSTAGMLALGDWQLHRALSGNQLSWAYTFEWPLFAAFTLYFWIKSLRDELRDRGVAADAERQVGGADLAGTDPAAVRSSAEFAAAASDGGAAPTVVASAGASTGTGTAVGDGAARTARAVPASRQAASWDATSWNAASWQATGRPASAEGEGKPVDVARATPADGEAYVARLMAEVRPGRRRTRRSPSA